MRTTLSSVLTGFAFASTLLQPAAAKSISKLTVLVGSDSDIQAEAQMFGEGDTVLEQSLFAKDRVVLGDDVLIFVRKTGNTRIELPAGTAMFQARSKKGQTVYCSMQDGFLVSPNIGKPFGLQVCFEDADENGSFEKVYSSEKGQLDVPRLSMNRLMKVKRDFQPIVYSQSSEGEGLSVDARIMLDDINETSIAFELQMLTDDGKWERHGRTEIDLVELPSDISPFGTKLFVASHDADSGRVELSVYQGFSRSRYIPLGPGMMNSKRDFELID